MDSEAPKKRGKRPQSPLRNPKIRKLDHPYPDEMTEEQAFEFFKKHRFATNGGKPQCPFKDCKCETAYTYKPRWNRPRTALHALFKCEKCHRQFTVTSKTPLAYHKMTFKQILSAIWDFAAGANGSAALRLSLTRNYDYKSAWVFFHKLRGAMMSDLESIVLDGEVEIDGTEIGGYVKPKNARKEKSSKDPNKTKKNAYKLKNFGPTKCKVFVAYQRGGTVRTTIVNEETEAKPWVEHILSKGAILHADLAGGLDDLLWHVQEHGEFKRINHSENFWTGECHTNNAENYNSQLEHLQGVYRHISHPKYRHAYSEEMAWRMTNKKLSVGDKFATLVQAIGLPGRSKMKDVWRRKKEQTVAA